MAGLLDWITGAVKQQYAQGAPYREAVSGLLQGDPTKFGLLAQEFNRKAQTPEGALDVALNFAPLGVTKIVVPKTQYEIAQEVAQKNAALPVSKGGLGLPANNTAMDRAKAMGYTTDAYHGTPYGDIAEFKKSHIGKNFGADKEGFFFTSSPSRAGDYAMYDEIGMPTNSGQVIRAKLNMNSPLEIKSKGTQNDLIHQWDLNKDFYLDLIKNEGYGGAKLSNNNEEQMMMVLEPNQIRSINAAFDPFRRNDADILAGLLAVPATQLMKPEDKKKKRNTK